MRRRTAHPSSGFTLVELLVVIGLIALLVAILLPALLAAKERANRIKCASNLHQIDLALRAYALDNKGQYPRAVLQWNSPPHWYSGWFEPDPFGRDLADLDGNDVTAAVYLLVRLRTVPPGAFICPSTLDQPESSVRKHAMYGELGITQRSNFYAWQSESGYIGEGLSYGWVNQYPSAHMPRDYRQPPHGPADLVVAADRNDPVDRFRSLSAKAPPADIRAMNSQNHGGAGQNVLYNDGSVAWRATPFCGRAGDNIYTAEGDRSLNVASCCAKHKFDTIVLPQIPMKAPGP